MKNKLITATEHTPAPHALIIGDGRIPGYVLRALEDTGCTVDLVTRPESIRDTIRTYDYIFLFDSSVPYALTTKLLKPSVGKMLHIKTGTGRMPESPVPATVRLLYTGPLEKWDTRQITDIIFSTLFAGDVPHTTDVRTPVPQDTQPSSPAPSDMPHLPFRLPLGTLRPKTSPTRLHPQVKRTPPIHVEIRRHSFALPVIGGMVALLCTIGMGIAGMGFLYIRQIKQSHKKIQQHIQASDWSSVAVDLSHIEDGLVALQRLHGFLSAALPPLRTTRSMTDTGSILSSSIGLVSASSDAVGFIRDFRLFDTSFDGSRITTQDISRAAEKIGRVRTSFVDTRQHIQSVQVPIPARAHILSSLTSGIEQLSAADELLPVVKDLIAKEGKRTYMVLLQNPMELRPTGGFIGSFALMSAEKGKILEWKIMDVYDADGQLTGHVDPPAPIRKHLSQPNWFLRDSNFDPDFAVSAAWAAWFLQKELGIQVDGVIGVNLFLAQQLLRITGPLTLTDFQNETVSANTLFSKAHEQTQNGFFPGSTQKKDFLTAVSRELVTKFSHSKSLPWMDVLSVVTSSLQEKQVMFFSTDPTLQSYVEKRGWAGRITPTRCIEQLTDHTTASPCLADYLSVFEANLGINKANYIATKSVHVQKSVNAFGTVATILTLSYDNTDRQNIHYGEPYVNYVRIFVPRDSTVTGVTINDQPLSSADVDSVSYGADKHVFGFLVTIPPQHGAEVKIAYSLAEKIQPSTSRYQLIYQKQGGDKTGPLRLSVAGQAPFLLSPANFRASAPSDLETANGQSVTLSSDTVVDRVFAFDVRSTGN